MKREELVEIACKAMIAQGFYVDFGPEVARQLATLTEIPFPGRRDLTDWLWSSIDNDDTRDLDQLEFVEQQPQGFHLYVAIADVVSFVKRPSPIDDYAAHNTTSVYTGVETFHMLPEALSTDKTSLKEGVVRSAVIVQMEIDTEGSLKAWTVFPASVKNQAQLAYNSVAAWFEGTSPAPERVAQNPVLEKQLRLQRALAECLRNQRTNAGALDFQTAELRSTFTEEGKPQLASHLPNSATRLIEEFMIITNQAVDLFLEKKSPVIQRVVRKPKRWPRIVELAAARGTPLPSEPDALALSRFLAAEKVRTPAEFADLSLAILKLLGRGEYVVARPGAPDMGGHFGLAVPSYSHATAPNRRFADLVNQRLLYALFQPPLDAALNAQLEEIAVRCTQAEDAAQKVERSVRKSVAALALQTRIGEVFDGILTGSSEKGTWVRLRQMPVEGRIVAPRKGLDVGDNVRVRLVRTSVPDGYIDFELL